MSKVLFMLFCSLLLPVALLAQQDDEDPFAPGPQVPVDSLINITLTSRDTASLDYYNLYAFQYLYAGKQKMNAELMIPKKADTYRYNTKLQIKLCKVTSFINSFAGTEGTPIPVGDYIEITAMYSNKKLFLNFDPTAPNPVFTLCDNAVSKPSAR